MLNHYRYDVWVEDTEGEVGVLGSGSDYTSFLHKGMASVSRFPRISPVLCLQLQIDMGSDGGPTDPIYHYHSNYDSYHWMSTFGDPGFITHKSMGQQVDPTTKASRKSH